MWDLFKRFFKKEEKEQEVKMEVYCRKCKKKTEQKDAEIKTNKRGVKYSAGICSVCGTKTFVILKKE